MTSDGGAPPAHDRRARRPDGRTAVAASRRVIVNGDDFGLSPGINRGIIEAHRHGILTSASLMATGEAFEDAVALGRAHDGLSIGVHLTLTEGAPVSPPGAIPSLVGPDGRFPPSLGAFLKRWISGRVRLADVRRELGAQVEKVLGGGIRADKVDGHMHLHVLPGLLGSVLETARAYGIPAIRHPVERLRYRRERPGPAAMLSRAALSAVAAAQRRRLAASGIECPDHFAGIAESGSLTEGHLLRVLHALAPGVTEIMAHPGYHDAVVDRWRASARYAREGDLRALLSPAVRDLLRERRIELITFRDIRRHD
jgi:hopanoid biosynthesis associated protein HpnK